VQHRKLVAGRLAHDIRKRDLMRDRIDQLAVRHHRGDLGEPGRIPERADFAAGLVARTSAAIETIEGRSLQEQRAHTTLSGASVAARLRQHQ